MPDTCPLNALTTMQHGMTHDGITREQYTVLQHSGHDSLFAGKSNNNSG